MQSGPDLDREQMIYRVGEPATFFKNSWKPVPHNLHFRIDNAGGHVAQRQAFCLKRQGHPCLTKKASWPFIIAWG
jgi:hypothetical protein